MGSATSYANFQLEELDEGSFLRLTLDAGKGNVIGLEALRELRGLWADLANRPHVKAVVLDHTGKHFSFGASVDDHVKDRAPAMLAALHGLAKDVVSLGVPVLVAVRGMCLGGGLELALLGSRIFATEEAQFGQPEVSLGVFAPLGSLLLPSMIGNQVAAEMLLSGRMMGASEAEDRGLVGEIVTGLGASADPGEAALAWAREHLAPKSAAALRFATRALWEGRDHAFARRLDKLEQLYLAELMETHDANEGIAAFLDGRRTPEWKDA